MWDEEGPPLNIARAHHSMVAVGNLVFVFGGYYYGGNCVMEYFLKSMEQWIEVYNLDHPDPSKWEFLPISSAPPQDIFSSGSINHHIVYERGNQILFFIREHIRSSYAVYSFDYVTQTWSCFDESLHYDNEEPCTYSLLRCNMEGGITILDHVLCWEYFGTIYAYDLRAGRLISTHRLNQEFNLAIKFIERPEYYTHFSEGAFLVCVGKNQILLIMFEFIPRTIYHFYIFRIDKSLGGFRLALDGSKSLQLQGASAKPMVVPSSSLSHRENI